MARTTVETAEAILDQPIQCLDKGFVRLVDYMGGDDRIVQSARVSYGAGTKSYRQDRGLIHYLLRNRHTSPFEQVVLTFHAKMPILVARQWVRHRMARLNEISGRYSVMQDEFYVPAPENVATQSADNKQGRGNALPLNEAAVVIDAMVEEQKQAYAAYQAQLERGVARELARSNLPLSLYTEWYWQIDLNNLFKFLELRMDGHAQYEIRVFANAMAECAKAVAPIAYEAFEEHILGAVTLSKSECAAVGRLLAGEDHGLEGRTLAQFESKLAKIQASIPTETPDEPQLPSA
jgi:thymidylate synthase (FAD)